MDRIKAISEHNRPTLTRRRRNWWEDDEREFTGWMSGQTPGNANPPAPISQLNQSKTDKSAILISQETGQNYHSNRLDALKARRVAAQSAAYRASRPMLEHVHGEQYTFAFIREMPLAAKDHIDTEV